MRLMPRRAYAALVSIVIWQFVSVAGLFVVSHTLRPIVTWAYEACFGSIQNSHGGYERLLIYLQIIISASFAAFVSLQAFDLVCKQRVNWVLLRRVFFRWQLIIVGLLIASFELRFAWRLHQLDWALSGPPSDIYTFRNLFLPRILAWLCCTVPPSWFALGRYSRLTNPPTTGFPVESDLT